MSLINDSLFTPSTVGQKIGGLIMGSNLIGATFTNIGGSTIYFSPIGMMMAIGAGAIYASRTVQTVIDRAALVQFQPPLKTIQIITISNALGIDGMLSTLASSTPKSPGSIRSFSLPNAQLLSIVTAGQ